MTVQFEQERISTLRRTIQQKRQDLGLDVALLELKGLKKFGSLETLNYPKSISDYRYFLTEGSAQAFKPEYFENETIGKHRYVFRKIVDEVSKKIRFDLKLDENTSPAETLERVQLYLSTETPFSSFELFHETDEELISFLVDVFFERGGKLKPQTFFGFRIGENTYHTTFEMKMPEKVEKAWRSAKGETSAIVRNFVKTLAMGTLLNVTASYLFKNEENQAYIKRKLQDIATFDEELFDRFTETELLEALSANPFLMPDFYKSIIVLALEEMLHDGNEIRELETRLTSLSRHRATAYMTKKNIPLKIQAFMNQNHFLAMFGQVEADELCELDKLNQLSVEFMELAKKFPLPQANDHALRFRRLGNHKAAGIYFPGLATLAVDLDSPHSFIHELFHLIDFTRGILSADQKFKPLLQRYREVVDTSVRLLGKDDELYQSWFNGKSKYSRQYYFANEEVFARLGELYVLNVLKIEGSFNQRAFTSSLEKVVYPRDGVLDELLTHYFNDLFETLWQSDSRVCFDEGEPVAIKPASSTPENRRFESNSEERVAFGKAMPSSVETFPRLVEQLSLFS